MKYCPICDKQINSTFCKGCKRFVKPYELRNDIFINRRKSTRSPVVTGKSGKGKVSPVNRYARAIVLVVTIVIITVFFMVSKGPDLTDFRKNLHFFDKKEKTPVSTEFLEILPDIQDDPYNDDLRKRLFEMQGVSTEDATLSPDVVIVDMEEKSICFQYSKEEAEKLTLSCSTSHLPYSFDELQGFFSETYENCFFSEEIEQNKIYLYGDGYDTEYTTETVAFLDAHAMVVDFDSISRQLHRIFTYLYVTNPEDMETSMLSLYSVLKEFPGGFPLTDHAFKAKIENVIELNRGKDEYLMEQIYGGNNVLVYLLGLEEEGYALSVFSSGN